MEGTKSVVSAYNGESEVAVTSLIHSEREEADESTHKPHHPTIPGWFAEHCPVWPGL